MYSTYLDMKRSFKLYLIVFICICSTIFVNAQSRISSVFGVNLGDSEQIVTSKISGKWKTSSKGERSYVTTNPTLGSCTFEAASFTFKSNKLYKVIFYSSEGGLCNPNFQGAYGTPNGYELFLGNAQKYKKIYNTMYFDLFDKYGSPVLNDEERALWKSNGNTLELKYDYDDTTTEYGWHDTWVRVAVTYQTIGFSSSNF